MPLRARRRLLLLFLLVAVGMPVAIYVLSSFSYTLTRLDAVEAERDQWQRPADVVQALDVREGSRVVDLGSGAGYFALKIAALAGKSGEVAAVDLRSMSLLFLRTRALLRGLHNVDVVVATADDPRLQAGSADAVLIANTYHEFAHPELMLAHTYRALRPGGRLVIVDRAPGKEEAAAHGHEVQATVVDDALRRNGFEVMHCNERFIDRLGDDPWWLIVARRPQ